MDCARTGSHAVVFVSKIVGLEKGLLGADQLCLSCCHPSINGGNEEQSKATYCAWKYGDVGFEFSRIEMASS